MYSKTAKTVVANAPITRLIRRLLGSNPDSICGVNVLPFLTNAVTTERVGVGDETEGDADTK